MLAWVVILTKILASLHINLDYFACGKLYFREATRGIFGLQRLRLLESSVNHDYRTQDLPKPRE